MIGDPFDAGAVKFTVARTLPAVAITGVGMPGTPFGVTAFDGADGGPVPSAFVAVTVNVYVVPSFSRVTPVGLVLPETWAPPGETVTV